MSTYSFSQKSSARPPSGYNLGIEGSSVKSRPQSSTYYLNSGKSQNQKSEKPSRIQSAAIRSFGNGSSRKAGSIGVTDLMRIREKIGLDENLENEIKQEQKLSLYEKSKSRSAKWTNTLAGNRKKKNDQRFERFKADEEKRRQIDEEEKKYYAGIRKDILDKANKQLYERDDRVKEFQSKINLVETIDQRNQQVELKKQVNEIHKKREEIYKRQLEEALKKEEEKEFIKQEIIKKKRAQTAKVLREQHEEQRQKFIEQIQNQKIEGEIIKVRAQEVQEKEKQEEILRLQKAKQLQQEIRKGNEDLKALRSNLKNIEKEEDKKIAQFAEKKDKMAEMRKQREEFIFKQKQEERQKLIDIQTAQLKKMKDEENAKLSKDIKEAEIKAEQIELIKKQKRKQLVEKIDESLKVNMERKRVQSARQKQEDEEYKNYWIDKNQKIQEREAQDKADFRQRCKDLQEFQRVQAQEKQKIREKQVYGELEEEEKIRQIQENDTQNFNSWARRMIEAQKAEGRDILPLLTKLKQLNK